MIVIRIFFMHVFFAPEIERTLGSEIESTSAARERK
jgi:hypothetical protein